MENTNQHTPEILHSYLVQFCELDKQKLKYKVTQDLVFYCKITESEANDIWNEGIKQGILTLINHWEKVPEYQYYKYHGQKDVPQPEIQNEKETDDFTNKGMSTTYHNTKTPESLKHGRYGKGSINNISKRRKKAKA